MLDRIKSLLWITEDEDEDLEPLPELPQIDRETASFRIYIRIRNKDLTNRKLTLDKAYSYYTDECFQRMREYDEKMAEILPYHVAISSVLPPNSVGEHGAYRRVSKDIERYANEGVWVDDYFYPPHTIELLWYRQIVEDADSAQG